MRVSLGIADIAEKKRTNKLKLYGHIEIMKNYEIAEKVREIGVEESRGKDKPKK